MDKLQIISLVHIQENRICTIIMPATVGASGICVYPSQKIFIRKYECCDKETEVGFCIGHWEKFNNLPIYCHNHGNILARKINFLPQKENNKIIIIDSPI